MATCEKYTVSGSGDGKIKLWDNTKTEPSEISLDFDQAVHHLAINSAGTILAAVGYDAQLYLFDLVELKLIETCKDLYSESRDSWAVSFARQVDQLAVSTIDGCIKLWDMNDYSLIRKFESPNKRVFGVCVDVSADGAMVAIGFEKGGINVYSVSTGRLIYAVSGHTSTVRTVKFSPMGTILAAAGDSKSISLYSTESGEHVVNLSGHEGWIFCVDWSEAGEHFLSVDYSGKCKIWSIESRSCVATQSESEEPLLCGAWLKPGWGKGIVGGHNQGIVTVGIDRSIRWYREASGSS